jgi:hypothetical protein
LHVQTLPWNCNAAAGPTGSLGLSGKAVQGAIKHTHVVQECQRCGSNSRLNNRCISRQVLTLLGVTAVIVFVVVVVPKLGSSKSTGFRNLIIVLTANFQVAFKT